MDRTRKEFSDEDIAKIADTYHTWRGEAEAGAYEDVPGFCKSAPLEEIRGHNHVLTPGRYVSTAVTEEDDAPFEERFAVLKEKLDKQLEEREELGTLIKAKLEKTGAHR